MKNCKITKELEKEAKQIVIDIICKDSACYNWQNCPERDECGTFEDCYKCTIEAIKKYKK